MEVVKQMLTEHKATPQPQSQSAPESRDKDKDKAMGRSDIKLTEKSYKRMERFSGGDDEWEDWKYDFEIITRSVNPAVGEALTKCLEDSAKATTGDDFNRVEANREWGPVMRSKELYELFIMMTAGEAESVMKSATEDGFEAWHLLSQTYSRKTLAKTLRLYREASNPSPATQLSEVISRIATWESKVQTVLKVTGLRLDNMLELAALT